MVAIIESLITMEYVDYEVFQLLLLYVLLFPSRLRGKSPALTSMPFWITGRGIGLTRWRRRATIGLTMTPLWRDLGRAMTST